MSVCVSVRTSVSQRRESDLGRIWLAHAEFINLESETVIVFLTSPTMTSFPADRARARISPERRIVSPPNSRCPFRRRTVRAERVVYCGRRRETEDIFADIRVLKKYTYSRMPVYDRRRAAVFDAPVPRNASSVFEETTFNGTVEMARVGTSRDFVRYGAAVFNAPVSRNASNVFEETTFSGTVEKARVGIRYIRGTDYPGKYCT